MAALDRWDAAGIGRSVGQSGTVQGFMQPPILLMLVASFQAKVPPDISNYVPPTPGCNFAQIAFSSGSARLAPPARAILDIFIHARNEARYPWSFELDGYTDRVGSNRANRRLAL